MASSSSSGVVASPRDRVKVRMFLTLAWDTGRSGVQTPLPNLIDLWRPACHCRSPGVRPKRKKRETVTTRTINMVDIIKEYTHSIAFEIPTGAPRHRSEHFESFNEVDKILQVSRSTFICISNECVSITYVIKSMRCTYTRLCPVEISRTSKHQSGVCSFIRSTIEIKLQVTR